MHKVTNLLADKALLIQLFIGYERLATCPATMFGDAVWRTAPAALCTATKRYLRARAA